MSSITFIVKLDTRIQPYAWGSHSAIAELQGRPSPTPCPEAELWIGDHPKAPSRVVEANGVTPLDVWYHGRRSEVLGPGRSELPYLVKILAAAEPLSVQLHPNAQQAADGFAREEAAGIARDDDQRSYCDGNAKVEAVCALGRFEALCGLRPGAQVRQRIAESRSEVAAHLLAETGDDAADTGLAGALLCRAMRLGSEDPPRSERLAAELTRYGELEQGRSVEANAISQLASSHPGDRMLIAPLLLNHVVLERGQALELSPNTVHSYLSGLGVEVMTSSDNVVRAGLTQKHVAEEEFASLLDARPTPPQVHSAPPQSAGPIAPYSFRTDEFRFNQVVLRADRKSDPFRVGRGQPRILVCVKGELALRHAERNRTLILGAGEAALIPACVGEFEMTGPAEGFLVQPGER